MFLLSFSAFSDWLPDLKVPRSHLRWIEPALAILVIAHLVGPTTPATLNLLPLTSRERDVFLESNIPAWLVIRELNEMDPPPVVYFLYGENARHYCRFPLYSGWRDPYGFMVFREHASSGSELGAWLEEIGVDILIVNGRRQWGIPDDIGKALSSDEFIRLYRPDIVDYRLTSVFVKSDLGYRLQVQKRKDSGPTQ
jgi:hypothetical protein